jgi:hypothetical protein
MKLFIVLIATAALASFANAGSSSYTSRLPMCPLCQDVYEGLTEAFPSPIIYPPPCDGGDRQVYYVVYIRLGQTFVNSGSCGGHILRTKSNPNSQFDIKLSSEAAA